MADKQLAEAEARIEAEISSQQAHSLDETDVAKKMQWQAMEHLTSKQNKAEHTPQPPRALLACCGAWALRPTAKALSQRNALAGLWISDKNSTGIPKEEYRRCWPFHLAIKPFYHFGPQTLQEKLFYAFLPIWKAWLAVQHPPQYNVVHAIMGYATEIFDMAERCDALKVICCANSHPTSYYGSWQRECDIWCPGEKVPVPRWMFARMNRELERADLILVESQYGKESMIYNGIRPEKVVVNPLGVDTSIFKKRTEIPATPRFICLGTICLRKGHQYLFRAFEIVKTMLPEAELICRGDYKGDFRKERPNWEGTFTQIGHLPLPELANLLQSCTAFVFPSTEEGVARAQVEALASGLPVIGTHEGGATTLVEDGVEGFIVRGRDPLHIAQAMVKVATDRDLNRRMGEAAYLKGALNNNWLDYGDRLLKIYQRALEDKRAKQK
jgi:glycosyltransferase involved in cell wall biosynthesis